MPNKNFEIILAEKADDQLTTLEQSRDKKIALKAVRKTLGLMETDLRHPSLYPNKLKNWEFADAEHARFDSEKTVPLLAIGAVFSGSKVACSAKEKTNSSACLGIYTHEYHELSRLMGTKIFESYAQNKTPGAYRVFWHYGPEQKQITVIAIILHP